MISIPEQLKNYNFRFFKANGKIPIEKSWNKDNNYQYFDPELLKHKGNLGICTGYEGLIVMDFDDRRFLNKICAELPVTFTILTASKGLFHFYYLLNGEMFKKIMIDDKKGNRLADIQGKGFGVIAPGSKVGKNHYKIINPTPIASITMEQIKEIFGKYLVKHNQLTLSRTQAPYSTIFTKSGYNIYQILELANKTINMKKKRHECPLHSSDSKASLAITSDGEVFYCHHCHKSGNAIKLWALYRQLTYPESKHELSIILKPKK